MKLIYLFFIGISLVSLVMDKGNGRNAPKKPNTHTHSRYDSTTRNTELPPRTDIPTIIDRDSIYTQVEQRAYFAGGDDALIKHINRYLVQPKPKRNVAIRVRFVVERYGAVTKIHVTDGEEYVAESNEAIRVVHSTLSWEPAKIRGTSVASLNEISIQFGKK